MRQRIIDRGAVPDPRGPGERTDFVNARNVKWAEVVKRADLKAGQAVQEASARRG